VRRIAALAIFFATAACESVIGAEFDTTTVECKHVKPPQRPAVQNAGGEATGDILAAITTVDAGDRKLADGTFGYRTIGFDLDGVCSNLGERPTCRSYAWAFPDPTDGVDGIDNQGGALIAAQNSLFGQDPLTSEKITRGIAEGSHAPLGIVRIRGYNLADDDDHVEVDWYVGDVFGVDANKKPIPPKLDDNDAWPIREGLFENGEQRAPDATTDTPYPRSVFRDPNAYVNLYTLVAQLPRGTPLRIAQADFVTEGLTVVLKLAYHPTPRVVSGTVTGFVRLKSLFEGVPTITSAFKFDACKDSIVYPRVKTYFCRFADSHSDGRNDPDTPCDAISMGFSIGATNVKPGPTKPAPTPVTCSPETDPSTDSCDVGLPPLAPVE
jgi:hypothetical protein